MKEFDIKEESLNFHALLAKNWGALTTKGADGRVYKIKKAVTLLREFTVVDN